MKKETYTITVLDNDKFDKLPYENISDSLGFADPETGNAFVRRTGVPDWDAETIQHEIQELLAKDSFHTDANNIRHKKFFKQVGIPALATLAGALVGAPFLGALGAPLGAAAGSAIQQQVQTGKISPLQTGLSALGGAIGGPGIKAGFAGAKAAGKGFLGTVGSGIKGAFVGAPSTAAKAGQTTLGALQGPVTQAQSQLGFSNLSQVPSNILGSQAAKAALAARGGPVQGPVTAAQFNQGFTNLSQVPRVTTVGAPAGGATLTPLAPTGQAPLIGQTPPVGAAPTTVGAPTAPGAVPGGITPAAPTGILGRAAEALKSPQTLLGLGTSAAGLIPKTPEFQLPASVSQLQQRILSEQGLTDIGQQARGALQDILSTPASERFPVASDDFFDATLRRTRESHERALEEIDAAYNRAGVLGSGEHLAARAELNEQLARTESQLAAQVDQRRFELARTEQYQAIQEALGVDKQVMDDLVGITGLDVELAAQIYGAKVADVNAIREALGTLGSELLIRGLGPQTPGTVNINPAGGGIQ